MTKIVCGAHGCIHNTSGKCTKKDISVEWHTVVFKDTKPICGSYRQLILRMNGVI